MKKITALILLVGFLAIPQIEAQKKELFNGKNLRWMDNLWN